MKKIFTLMMAFLAMAGNAVWGQTTEVSLNDYQESAYEVQGNGTFHITGSNSTGIQIARGSNATVILEDVSITGITNVAIEVNGGARPTFILKGENKIESENGPAIRVPRDGESVGDLRTGITFSEQSTGSLIVDANGNVGIGIEGALPAGDITINGGTIIIDGIISDGTCRDRGFNMNGNAVVIVDEIDWHEQNISSGILFENSTTGQMYGNVELKSPLDLTDNDLTDKLNLRGGTLTIGDKNSLKRDATEDVDGGTVVAFVANYNENSPAGCSATDAKQDYTLYGTNTEIILQTEYPTCNNNTHQSLGWTKGENPTSVEGATITTDASYPIQTTNNIELNAAWVEIAKTISAEEGKDIPTENNYNKLIVHPSSLNVTYTLTNSTSVNGVTFENGALTGTPAQGTAGDYEYKVNVACGNSTVEATITLKVADTPLSIENATIELSNQDGFTYNGAEQYPIVLKVDGVEVPKEAYTCTWTEATGETVFKKAGTYELTMIEAVENSGYTGYVDNTIIEAVESIVMNPRDLKVSINNQTIKVDEEVNKNVVSQGGEGETTILIDSKTTLSGEQPAFTGNLACAQSTNVPGEYPGVIEQGTMELSDNGSFLKKNYKLNVTKKGTLTVTTTIDDPEDIELVITDAVTKDDKYIYDGVDYKNSDQEIVIKIKLSDGTSQTIDSKYYTISWDADEVKNVGTYTASITFNSDIYGSATVSKTIEITQRSLTVNLTEVPATIPNDVNLANLESWWSPWDEVSYVNVVEPEKPEFAYDAISLIDKNGNKIERLTDGAIVKVKLEGLALKDGEEGFLKMNYTPIWMYGGTEVDVEADGSVILPPTDGDDEDDNTGIEVVDPDDSGNSGSGITTKRYQLYLANKDYNVKDAKEDYAAEGLELFSRHNKKYTNAGGSFTVWYEHDGEVNEGGYRVFWSSRANGEYKEVKLDEVSGYYQIRNVNSNVYVRIYAADGFPVGNEEISAADYRAYAQPNKIVVITPQPTDVQIISMAGAVVATDKVTGQREFANLSEGVYIVRMGETVVKLQVRK